MCTAVRLYGVSALFDPHLFFPRSIFCLNKQFFVFVFTLLSSFFHRIKEFFFLYAFSGWNCIETTQCNNNDDDVSISIRCDNCTWTPFQIRIRSTAPSNEKWISIISVRFFFYFADNDTHTHRHSTTRTRIHLYNQIKIGTYIYQFSK